MREPYARLARSILVALLVAGVVYALEKIVPQSLDAAIASAAGIAALWARVFLDEHEDKFHRGGGR